MKFLLRITKALRPKRRDLVDLVERHIKDNYDQPETILDDMESSSDGHLTPRPPTPVLVDATVDECCTVRCGCFNCNCNPCCSGCCCCVIMAVLFSFFAVVAVLVWYTQVFPQIVQHYLEEHDMSRFGPLVIGGLLFIAVCCIPCGFYIRYMQRRRGLAYSALAAVSDTRSISNHTESGSLYAASDSTYARGVARPRRRECSCSSGHITASSSLASLGSSRMPRRIADSETVTDGCSQQDVIPQEIEADREDKDDNEFIEV